MSDEKIVFCTVGTTQFDELISHVFHPDTLEVIYTFFFIPVI